MLSTEEFKSKSSQTTFLSAVEKYLSVGLVSRSKLALLFDDDTFRPPGEVKSSAVGAPALPLFVWGARPTQLDLAGLRGALTAEVVRVAPHHCL